MRGDDGEMAELRDVSPVPGGPPSVTASTSGRSRAPSQVAAGDARHVLVQPVARQLAFALVVQAGELRDQALEGPLGRDRLAAARAW